MWRILGFSVSYSLYLLLPSFPISPTSYCLSPTMYPIPPNEHLVETRTCKHCSASFPITDKDMDFYSKVSPVFPSLPVKGGTDEERGGGGFGTWNQNPPWSPLDRGVIKYQIPPPTLCPDCRQQRRLSFRNERKLYKRKCDATGKEIVSMYHPESEYTIYDPKYWWSDKWDPISYGKKFDFSKSFFEQYNELSQIIPRTALILPWTNENSDYANDTADAKNCYMVCNAYIAESCYYSYAVIFWTKNCVDCSWLIGSEQCYECSYSQNIQYCQHCELSTHLSYSQYCSDCHGCSYCFGCVGLTNAQYHIFNQKNTKEEYEKKILSLSKITILDEIRKLVKSNIHNVNCENIFNSDICKNSHDLTNCLNITNGENCKYGNSAGWWIIDSYDFFMAGTPPMSKTLETIGVYRTFQSAFLFSCDESRKIYYSDTCFSGNSDLFGCFGLRWKSYCILNKQYTKEEYEVLVPKIIEKMMADGEWGEFFPASMSPFGYNETVANEYYPLSKWEAIEKWIFNWSDYEAPFPTIKKVIPASKLPDTIESIPDDILNWAIECEVSKKPFRIIKQELEFYRKHNLPIPRRHPDQRHRDRMALRNPRKLFERSCDKCQCDMITTYAPERPEIVYCEKCYNKEVMG